VPGSAAFSTAKHSTCRAGITLGLRWCALLLLLFAGFGAILPARAAVELVSLTVTPMSDRVRIEWETAREYDVAAFQLLFKREDEPVASFQPIGQPIPAQGDLESGAIYQAEFFQLQPSVSYCFRLVEVTTNEDPGDVFDRCGYGLGTFPTATPAPDSLFTPTPEPELPEATETPEQSPALQTPDPGSAIPSDSPLATPIPEPDENGGVIVNFQTPAAVPEQSLEGVPEISQEYLVQTATPTPTPLQILPTLTPLPTVTPTPAFGLGMIGFLGGPGPAPGSLPNILMMLLCLGSVGLALLGVMTLLGTIFYLRSRL
jgi:hypothetical protein